MKRRREVSEEERELFESSFAGSSRKKSTPAKHPRAKPAAPAAKNAAPRRQRDSQPSGLDGRTAERLSRGQLVPEARLDLHGLTEAAAHRALVAFLHGAHARGVRLALIVTGKGVRSEDPDAPFDLAHARRGVLKRMTPRWLKEPELARFVADLRTAHVRHGGDGALYVYLRKPR
jgi:DNA-nicking Smr family endonuclease